MAEETIVEQAPPQDVPYVDRVYAALKDNLSGFDKTPEQFKTAMQDSGYAAKAYTALKDNLTGFDKSENDFYSQVGLKKKQSTPALPNGVDLSGRGLNPFQNTQAPTDLIPVLPEQRDKIRSEQKQRADNLSNQLKENLKALNPETRAEINKITNMVANRGELKEVSQEDQDHYNFMQTPGGKLLGDVAYLGQKATKGSLQVLKGAAYLMDGVQNPNSILAGTPTSASNALDYLDSKNTMGLTKGDEQRIGEGAVMQNLGGLAEFLPSVAASAGTGGAPFYLQGIGQGKEAMDAAEKNGAKINPLIKNAFILGTGAVNGLLMGELGSSMFKSLPNTLRRDIATKISVDAIKEAAGRELTGQEFENLLQQGVKKFGDKLADGGVSVLEGYKHAATNLGALTGANFALKKGVDVVNDSPVFNESAGDLAEQLNDVATKQAPFFAIPSVFGAASRLNKYSHDKNVVVDELIKDSSPENINRVKDAVTQEAQRSEWSPQETEKTLAHVDEIATIAKSLPKTMAPYKLPDAVDLVQGRRDLENELSAEVEQREQLDPALADIVTPKEQLLTDKIEQANDKLRDLATGSRTTYSKGVGEEDGLFFKTVNGKKEEISPSRYALESLERDSKVEANEQTEPNKEVPVEQPADETVSVPEVTDQNVETAENSPIKPVENESTNEKSSQESGEKGSTESTEVDKTVRPEKSEVVKTAKEKAKTDTIEEVKPSKEFTGFAKSIDVSETTSSNTLKSKEGDDVYIELSPNESSPNRASLSFIEVPENKRGQGIAKGKLTDIALKADEQGITLDLSVDKNANGFERLKKLYESVGFKEKSNTQKGADGLIYMERHVADTGGNATQSVTKAGDPLREFANKVREGKISKLSGFRASTGFDGVWDTSLEVVAKSIEGGAKIADAIEAGLKHIRSTDWYKSLADKKEFDEQYTEHMTGEYASHEKAQPEMTGIRHADTEKSRKESGLPEYDKISKSEAELNAQADKAMEDGYKVPELINRMEKGELPKDYEQVILRKFISSVSAEIAENPSSENIGLYKRALDVSDAIGGSELARSLAARRGLVVKENNLANFILDEMNAFGVDSLPKEVIGELKTEWDQSEHARLKYEEGYKKALDDVAAQKAKTTVEKTRGSIPKERKTSAEYAKERVAIVTDMRAALLKAAKGGYGAMSSIPYAAQLKAISPYIPKLVRNLVGDGKNRAEDIIKSIHSELKDMIDDITEKDVRDLIAGEYREKKSRNEVAAQIRDIRTQAKLISKIMDLEAGIKKTKNIGEKISKTKEVEALEKELREAELRTIELEGPEDKSLTKEQRLKTKQTALKTALAKAKFELQNSSFDEVPPPTKLILDAETRKYQDELIDIRKKVKKRRDKAYYDRLPRWERNWDKFLQVLGLKRIVQTAIDLSMPFRQGIGVTLNPRAYGLGLKNITSLKGLLNTPEDVTNSVAVKSWANMFKTVFSQKNFDRMTFEMEKDPVYGEMVEDKLHFNDVETLDNNNRNEDFRASFVYEIPYVRGPLIASNRAAAGFINTARYELYLKGKKTLEQQGVTRENSPESYTELAKWAMNLTGRGNFHKALENNPTAQRVLGNTFYGARLMASRFNLLNPNYYYKMPKEMRVEALKDLGAYASMAVVTMLAAKAAGAQVTLNPDDPDFGKAVWGDKHYDIVSGGISQYIRTYLRIAKAIYLRANPNVSKKKADKYSKFAAMSTSRFFQYKLAPNTAYSLAAFNGKDAMGKDFNAMDIAKIYPMYVDDMVEGWQKDGPTTGMTILLPSIVGMGVQNYKDRGSKKH